MTRMSLFNSPLLLGFDHVERVLDRVAKSANDGYPPYNIEQTGDQSLRITLAVAGFELDDARAAGKANTAPVDAVGHLLHPVDGVDGEPVEEAPAVEGLSGGEPEFDGAVLFDRAVLLDCAVVAVSSTSGPAGTELCRGAVEDLADRVVELADRVEAGGEGDLGEGEVGRFDEGSGGASPSGPGEGEGAGPDLGVEESMEVAGAHVEIGGKSGDAESVDRSVVDRSNRSGDEVVAPVPLGRTGGGVG